MPRKLKSYTSFYPIRSSVNGLHADSKHGMLHVWADENGVYVDIQNDTYGDICIASFSPTESGIIADIFGDHKSAEPTQSFLFDDLQSIFQYDYWAVDNDGILDEDCAI